MSSLEFAFAAGIRQRQLPAAQFSASQLTVLGASVWWPLPPLTITSTRPHWGRSGYCWMTGNWKPKLELSLIWFMHSNFRLLRQFQGILDLYAEVTHSALEFGVSQKQLHTSDFFWCDS